MPPILRTLAAGAVAIALAAPAVHAAQEFDLGTADFTTWQVYGHAGATQQTANGFLYRTLHLSYPRWGDTRGAGWAPAPVVLDFNAPFRFDFVFFIPPGDVLRGDGLTFALATNPGVGGGGSDLGYGGLTRSVAFAIDTFHFGGEPVSPSLQILYDGNASSPVATFETGLGDGIRDQSLQWRAWVTYTPSGTGDETGWLGGGIWRPDFGTYSVETPDLVNMSIVGEAVADENMNFIGRSVFFGFTGANGLADDGHFVTSAVPVPEPEAWAMLLAGLGLAVFGARRRAAVAKQV